MEKKNLLYALIVFISFFLPLPLCANEDVNNITAWVKDSQCQVEAYLEDAQQLKIGAETAVQNLMKQAGSKGQCCQDRGTVALENQNTETKNNPSTLIFVSLSMPKDSLRTLYKEVERQGLSLLIRGLKNNSFKETAEALRELEIAAEIDPQLFEDHSVKVVPTFVRLDKNEFLYIKGNVSLHYAQQKFEEAL